MPPLACKFEELDEPTRKYLHDVAARRGRGAPGVYVHRGNSRPLWAILVGPVLAFVMLVGSCGSSKDPWAVALIQTAAVLIGGWSVWYAVRRWVAGRGTVYGGHFAYFDPLFAYDVRGEMVAVTDLAGVLGVAAKGAGNGTVVFDLGPHGTAAVTVANPRAARDVEDYYAAMDDLERREDSPWAAAAPAELGAAAKFVADEDHVPRDVGELTLDIDPVPEHPERTGRAGFGWFGLLVIVVGSVGAYGLFWGLNAAVADDLAFDHAKDGGAPGLRGYLLDDRNKDHRDEAKQLLSSAYDAPIARVRSLPAGERPELRDGMVKLLDSLRTADAAVVSIEAKDDGAVAAGADVPADPVAREVADGLARGVGPDLIAFAKPADGVPAHVTVRYKLARGVAAGAGVGPVTGATLTVELRTDPKAAPVATGTWQIPATGPMALDAIKVAVCRELVGEYKPAPPADTGGGDF